MTGYGRRISREQLARTYVRIKDINFCAEICTIIHPCYNIYRNQQYATHKAREQKMEKLSDCVKKCLHNNNGNLSFRDFIAAVDTAGIPVHEIKKHMNVATGNKSIIDHIYPTGTDFLQSLAYIVNDNEQMVGTEDGYFQMRLKNPIFGFDVLLRIMIGNSMVEVLRDTVSKADPADYDVYHW